MDYSIEQAKTIFGLLHDLTWYAIPLFLALIFPLLWVMFKKLLGLSNSSQKAETAIDKFASFISLQGDSADKIVFSVSIIFFVGGVIVLKLGEQHEESLRRKALALKQYYSLNQDVMAIPKSAIPGYFQSDLDAILKRYPQDFIVTIDPSGDKTTEAVFCVDSNYVKNYKNNVNNYLTEYLDKKIASQTKMNVNVFSTDNYLQNFFVNRFVYHFLAQPATAAKYFLETEGKDVYISARPQLSPLINSSSQPTVGVQSACQTAVDNIIREIKSHNWKLIGFRRLRNNTHQNYTEDFLRQIPSCSAGRLELTKLKDDDLHDTVGFLMVK